MRPDPIFILGCHKSGTTLLRSLFDGIENHYVIPIETHCFQLLNAWIRYPFRKQFPQMCSHETFKQAAIHWIHHSNAVGDNQYSDSITLNWFDEKLFCEILSQKLTECDSRKDFIDSYFESIYASIHDGKELDNNIRFIEKSVENVEYAIDLSRMYPHAKFIHIIRNPYVNFVSLRKFKSSNGYPSLDKITKTLFESFYFLNRNESLIQDYKIIKYENLVRNTEKMVLDICDFVEMPFNKKMLVPTQAREKWKGNSISGKNFKGVSDERLGRWKPDIYPVEIGIVNKVFPHVLKRFGYTPIKSSFKKFLRCKGESPKKYIINRLFLKKAKSIV